MSRTRFGHGVTGLLPLMMFGSELYDTLTIATVDKIKFTCGVSRGLVPKGNQLI